MRKLLVVGLLMVPALAGCVGEFKPPEAEAEWLATFDQLTQVVPVPGQPGNYLALERHGEIHLFKERPGGWIEGSFGNTPVIIDLTDRVSDHAERGLKSLAFHPDFSTNGMMFVTYDYAIGAEDDGPGGGRLVRFQAMDPTDLSQGAAERDTLIDIEFPLFYHNMGMAQFGPDETLYVAFGDGSGGEERVQQTNTLYGKIIRIEVDGTEGYAIPAGNPFSNGQQCPTGSGEVDCGEVWLWGLRNSWRFSFAQESGDMYIADVGDYTEEEINIYAADGSVGRNFGWPEKEGTSTGKKPGTAQGDLVDPVLSYTHEEGRCAIIGGVVYDGDAFPALKGRFIFGDHCTAEMFVLDGVEQVPWFQLENERINSIDVDHDGEILVTGFSGRVNRIQ